MYMKHIIYIFFSTLFALCNSQSIDPLIFKEEFHQFMPDCNQNARKWIRSAFHEAGTFDRRDFTGGSDGSLRFELHFPENVGVNPIVDFCENFVRKHNGVSFADTIMFGGKFAVEVCQGPIINWNFGRIDATGPNPRGKLPNPGDNIQRSLDIFVNRMGFTKDETVALILGGHSVARINLVFSFNNKPGFTDSTPHLLDNVIFKEIIHNNITNVIQIPADKNLLKDNDMKLFIDTFASNDDLFRIRFKSAFEKMINLGSRFQKTPTTSITSNSIFTTSNLVGPIQTSSIFNNSGNIQTTERNSEPTISSHFNEPKETIESTSTSTQTSDAYNIDYKIVLRFIFLFCILI